MTDQRLTEPISDLQMLYDYALSTATAATAYVGMATKSRNVKVRKLFLDLANHAADSSFETNDLIAKFGGEM